MERPKVIHNDRTGKYVMWFHLELKGKGYKAARVGVAVSDSPTGPFRYLGSMRPNGNMSRDMTLFKDDNGDAYLISSTILHAWDSFRQCPGDHKTFMVSVSEPVMAEDVGLFESL